MDYPKLRRDIEAFPVDTSGNQMLCFRDPLGFNPNLVFVPLGMTHLIRLLDGQHSLLDLQVALTRLTGRLVYSDDVQRLIEQLDAQLLLESDRFNQIRNQIEHEFVSSKARPAAHAGRSYPSDPEALKTMLDSLFSSGSGASEPTSEQISGTVKGIIAPHIDLRIGGPCYTYAYRELAERSTADTFVIFGTSHYSGGELFVLTRKDYHTPFGRMETDQEFIDHLEQHYGGSLSANDAEHRIEHSIEFQTLFLHYLFQNRRSVQIVPILCGSFHEMVMTYTQPSDDPRVRRFVEALKAAVKSSSRTIGFIAAADLAHIGKKFGDPYAAQHLLHQLEREDLEMLRYVENLDAHGFFLSIAKDGDSRKVCGLPPIYILLVAIEASRGKLLKYEQWSEEATQSAVTYASVVFH